MTKKMGVIPLTSLNTYVGPITTNETVADPMLLHTLVRNSRCPNFLGLRIVVISNLNIPLWGAYLTNYWDQQLPPYSNSDSFWILTEFRI